MPYSKWNTFKLLQSFLPRVRRKQSKLICSGSAFIVCVSAWSGKLSCPGRWVSWGERGVWSSGLCSRARASMVTLHNKLRYWVPFRTLSRLNLGSNLIPRLFHLTDERAWERGCLGSSVKIVINCSAYVSGSFSFLWWKEASFARLSTAQEVKPLCRMRRSMIWISTSPLRKFSGLTPPRVTSFLLITAATTKRWFVRSIWAVITKDP